MKQQFSVTGMTCSACSAHVEKAARWVEGVSDVTVSLLTNSMTVTYDEALTSDRAITDAVIAAGYGASVASAKEEQRSMHFVTNANSKFAGRQNLSIHDIDFVQYVFGQPKKVSGVYKKLTDNNDYIVSQLVYDGFDVTVTGGWFNCEIPFKADRYPICTN